MMRCTTSLIALALLCGCATPNPGIASNGNGLYTYTRLGGMNTVLSPAVLADLQRGAADFCATSGKKLVPVSSRAQDGNLGTYASAEMDFRCE